MLTLDETLRRRAEVQARETPEGAVLVDMADGRCWELNRVGAVLWSLLEKPITLRAACAALQARYQVAPEVLERDVLALANDLVKAGLCERASSPAAPR